MLACSDGTSIDAVQPDLEVEETVDFGDVQIGIDQPYALMVRNSGDGVLTVTDIERGNNFAGEGHEFAVSPVNFTLAPDQTQEVTVRFLPFVATEGLVRSSLKIVTNATNNG
ncbi:MAG: choice-of-anchor D domain-containing protein, partial [Deltaproteobacteria bacterium]